MNPDNLPLELILQITTLHCKSSVLLTYALLWSPNQAFLVSQIYIIQFCFCSFVYTLNLFCNASWVSCYSLPCAQLKFNFLQIFPYFSTPSVLHVLFLIALSLMYLLPWSLSLLFLFDSGINFWRVDEIFISSARTCVAICISRSFRCCFCHFVGMWSWATWLMLCVVSVSLL